MLGRRLAPGDKPSETVRGNRRLLQSALPSRRRFRRLQPLAEKKRVRAPRAGKRGITHTMQCQAASELSLIHI
eukprot:12960848-Alexandrium_andersonii.AAC.1